MKFHPSTLRLSQSESDDEQAYWDVPVFTDHEEVICNRVDARIVNYKTKRVVTLEMRRKLSMPPYVGN